MINYFLDYPGCKFEGGRQGAVDMLDLPKWVHEEEMRLKLGAKGKRLFRGELGLEEAKAQEKKLGKLEETCTACPAHFQPRIAGCIGKISFPISNLVEELLIINATRVLNEKWKEPASNVLRIIHRQKVEAETIKAWRAKGYLVLKHPVAVEAELKVEKGEAGSREEKEAEGEKAGATEASQLLIDTDQLLQIFFAPQRIPAPALPFLTPFLAELPGTIEKSEEEIRLRFKNSAQVKELLEYAKALKAAEAAGCDVIVLSPERKESI